MKQSKTEQLLDAKEQKTLVRFFSKFDSNKVKGYVLDVSTEWVLIGVIDDRIRPNGFECYRVADVKSIEREPFTEFVERALILRGFTTQNHLKLNLASTSQLLVSAAEHYSLITIHLEKARPDTCFIGAVANVDSHIASMLLIDCSANWDAKPSNFRLSEITRIDFGGDYEDALLSVGGEPPFSISQNLETLA